MIKNFKTVTVVGGGTSGWMTAAILIKSFPYLDITVVESSNAPVINIGESFHGGINGFLHYIGVKEEEFFTLCNASYKFGIKFNDFFEIGDGGYHYPFGAPLTNEKTNGVNAWLAVKAANPDLHHSDFVRCFFPAAALFENNKYDDNELGEFDHFNPRFDVAYHMDACKLAEFLREKYCKPRGVKVVDALVLDADTSSKGIDKLYLNNNTSIESDLFVDCTGFKRLLMSNFLKVPFKSIEHIVPLTHAWGTKLQYKDKEKELEGFTNATAIGNGWVWNIPTWKELSTGYSFSDKHISKGDALKEFKEHLKSSKMICSRNDEELEKADYKLYTFNPGVCEQMFYKNTVSIGTASGFIEPMEGAGLFLIHEFLFLLIKTLARGSITQLDRDLYNRVSYSKFIGYARFLEGHYCTSLRNDTSFWRSITSKSYTDLVNHYNNYDINIFNTVHHTALLPLLDGLTYTFIGSKMLPYNNNDLDKELNFLNTDGDRESLRLRLAEIEEMFNERKNRWQQAANTKPTLYQFLKQKYYAAS